jgi:hypothetical protein
VVTLSQDHLTSQERNKSSAFPQGDFAGSRPTTALRPRYESIEGAEVIIARPGKPAVRLAPVRDCEPPRKGGQWKGKVRIADDFDVLPDDVALSFGIENA